MTLYTEPVAEPHPIEVPPALCFDIGRDATTYAWYSNGQRLATSEQLRCAVAVVSEFGTRGVIGPEVALPQRV